MRVRWHDGPSDRLDPEAGVPVVWRVADPGRGHRADLARVLIARLSGQDVASIHLRRSAAGAPEVASPPGWYLGIAGRGAHCLIAAATRPIAVDRELAGDDPPLWDMLTPAEVAALRAVEPAARPGHWLRLWTIKEAHAKLIGEPRRLAPDAIETWLIDPCYATATCQGVSRCWTRKHDGAIETVAIWADAA